METTLTKPRKAWLAALLSLLGGGPLGQVYVGSLRRGVLLWFVGVFIASVVALSAMTLPIGIIGFVLLVMCAVAFPICLAVDAFLLARRQRDAPLKRYQRWWAYLLFFLVFVVTNDAVARGIRAYVVEAFVVPTRSMSPTIQAGERFLADKLWPNLSRLVRNDVVVFRSEGPDSPLYVMRVIGLPGEELEIKDERVLINGTAGDDGHAVFDGPMPPHIDMANYGPVKIPADCFFVLGDNRRRSKDSRFLGPIPLSDFYGKARVIFWSRPREFPDPDDTSHYELGPIRWDRIGTRLD